MQLLLCPKPHPARPGRPRGQRGPVGTPALSVPGCTGVAPLLPPDIWSKPSYGFLQAQPGVVWLEIPLGHGRRFPVPLSAPQPAGAEGVPHS